MLRGGIIGAGNVALRGHVPAWLACKEIVLTCAADTRSEARAELDCVLPGRTWYESTEALLASEPLDFVDVCTPPATHGDAIRSALRRGVHVLCEKPLVLESGEMEELRGLADSRRLVLAAVHNWRHAPVLAEATALVRAGAIGAVRRCRWEVLRQRPSAAAQSGDLPNWRLDPALSGGGILVDHGWHAAYVVSDWISGALCAVAARLETRKHREWAVEDTANVLLEFEGGEANLFLTWAATERRNRVEIEGTRGRIRIDGARLELEGDGSGRICRREFAESLSDGSHHPGWFQGVAAGFLDAIASPGRSSPSAAEAALCLEAILLAQESSRRGGQRVAAPAAEARTGGARR